MVRLHKVKMVNFGPFLDETIVFPEKGLVLLDGESGHGKSTVLVAIAYALDIAPSEYTATALQNWGGGPMQVYLTLEKDGEFVHIAKGKKNYIQYGAGPEKTGSKVVQEELKKLFSVSPDLLSVMVYRPQKTPGLFLSRTDTDKKAFLSTVLNLDAIEAVIDESTEKIKKLETQLEGVQAQLLQLKSFVKVVERPVLKSVEVFLDVVREAQDKAVFHEQKLEQLQKQLKDIAHNLVEANREQAELIEAKTAEAQKVVDRYVEEDRVKRKEFEKNRTDLLKDVQNLDAEIGELKRAEQAIQQVVKQITAIKVGLCYTCNRNWDQGMELRTELECSLDVLRANAKRLPFQQAKRDETYKQLQAIGSFVPNPVIAKLELGMQNARARVRELRSGSMNDPEFARCQQNIQTATSDYYKAKNELAGLQRDVQNIATENRLLMEQYGREAAEAKQFADAAARKEFDLKLLEHQLSEERDLKDALGTTGFLGLIFDEVLNEISAETNRYLATLKNVSHVTIDFKSEGVTSKGAIKRTIVPVVTVNGHPASLKVGVSGGMGTSIEMSVDFGVLKVVERRCGAAPGWLALDECFTGQPSSTKEAAMEILAQHAQDRLILVVDHSSEFKELFTKTIKIVMENGVSKVC